MSDLLRPTFEFIVPFAPEEAAARLDALYREGFVGESVRTHLLVTVPRAERHFWSPWLHVDLRRVEGDAHSTDVFARFSPAPSIWTGFMLTYIALATTALFCAVWAGAQLAIGGRPTMVWGVAAAVVVGGLMAWSARVGQRLAREQMHRLHDAVCGALATTDVTAAS
ncbi:MAG: hypothetical protein ACF8QF_03905 [Phycisphaerales bacterium]